MVPNSRLFNESGGWCDALVSRRQDNPDTGLGPRQEIVMNDEHSVVVTDVACCFGLSLDCCV